MPQNQKLSIAFLYDDSLDGSEGVTNQVKILGGWLSGRGHKVSYLVGETKIKTWQDGKVYSLAKNVRVKFNGNYLSIPLPARISLIKNALTDAKPDVLHVQMPHSPLMSQKVINMAWPTPAVGTFHIYPASALVRFGAKILKLAYLKGLSKISEVVSVSSAAQQFASDSFKLKTTVIPNMVDISKIDKPSVKKMPQTIVFLGRLVSRKGCAQLIEAFELVSGHLPQARLIIGGDGPERQKLEALSGKLGVTDKVEFRGFLGEQQKFELLAGAQIACFPSLYGESFGIVLIEAMAAGSGVVLAGDNPGYASVMAGIPEALFDPRDKQQFADIIISYLSNQALSDSTHKAQSQLVKKFDIDTVGPQIEALYLRAIDKASKTRHN